MTLTIKVATTTTATNNNAYFAIFLDMKGFTIHLLMSSTLTYKGLDVPASEQHWSNFD